MCPDTIQMCSMWNEARILTFHHNILPNCCALCILYGGDLQTESVVKDAQAMCASQLLFHEQRGGGGVMGVLSPSQILRIKMGHQNRAPHHLPFFSPNISGCRIAVYNIIFNTEETDTYRQQSGRIFGFIHFFFDFKWLISLLDHIQENSIWILIVKKFILIINSSVNCRLEQSLNHLLLFPEVTCTDVLFYLTNRN